MGFHVLTVLCFVISVLLLSSSPFSSCTLVTDREALLSFKSQITSDPSNTLSSWSASQSLMNVCNWTGVRCNNNTNNPRVVGLDLDGLGLSGTISPNISKLSFLVTLNLPNNKLFGTLPDRIGDLSRLRNLNLSSNNIQGSIPTNITKCNLVVLDMKANQLSGILPTELGASRNQLTKLQVIRLSQNRISGPIPPSIGNLSSLTNLDLATNLLGGTIPADLARLRNLKELRLSINNLTGTVPPALYNMSSLMYFAIPSNNLWGEIPYDVGETLPNLIQFIFCINKFTGGIPGSLHNLPNIQVIRMADNLLTGTIPPGLGNLPKLRMYNIGKNRIVSSGDQGLDYVINALRNSTQLEFLALEGNLLEGLIPDSISNLSPTLTKLYLGGNRIYGKIPSSIANLSNLALLNVSYNLLSGEIPSELGQLKKLQMLGLEGNKFSGEIPESLGNLAQLNQLELAGNELVGTIPASIGNLYNVLSLDLSRNRLTGSIPKQVFRLSSLTTLLNLSRNSFTGPLPSEIGILENLVTVDLSHNQLSGSIPQTVNGCISLSELFMSNNSFSGSIPSTLVSVKGLETLDLSFNQLSGPIPEDLQKLQFLQFMDLSFNDLEGRVPSSGIFRNLSRVDIQGNSKLCVPSNSNLGCDVHKKRSSAVTRVTIPVVASIVTSVLIVSLVCIIFMYKRNDGFSLSMKVGSKSRSSSDEEMFKGQRQMVSHDELRNATGNFDEANLIGRGSFGSVYRGTIWEGIEVSVKVLNLSQFGASKSFFAECEALRGVRHRNLVKLITSCSSIDFKNSDFRALVYEYLSNGSLEDWIRGRRTNNSDKTMNTMDRLNVAIDVASALDYLHNDCEPAVVHCDIKPSNVILDEDMTAKVGDFGLAKLLVEQSTTTSTYGLKGSIGYIPPEYGLGGKPSTKGDVYSYGVLLLELFTGKSPTDESFKGGISIAKWVQSSSPSNIYEVMDPELLLLMGGNDLDHHSASAISPEAELECWVSIMGVGLKCAADSPEARVNIREVLHKLKSIRETTLKKQSKHSGILSSSLPNV